MASDTGTPNFSGRCYCGALSVSIYSPADVVAYCHCLDCRRWTGAPLPAFAAFPQSRVRVTPDPGAPLEVVEGVRRWTCQRCGSPIAAEFDYLPGQVYVPLGIFADVTDLIPEMHCHQSQQVPWLHLDDGLPRDAGSGRHRLRQGIHMRDMP